MTQTQLPTEESTAAAEQLLSAFSTLRRQLRRTVGRPWQDDRLTDSQVELVRLVRLRPGLSVTEAAEELGIAGNTASALVSQLTSRGLLHRAVDDADRRVARLSLTPAARRRVEAWRDRRTTIVADLLDQYDEEARRRVIAALPTLTQLSEDLRARELEGSGP